MNSFFFFYCFKNLITLFHMKLDNYTGNAYGEITYKIIGNKTKA